MSFSDDDIRRGDTRWLGLHTGVVTNRDDPKKLGRVKFRIPGLVEPESAWAWPLTVGGGHKDRGLFFVPKVGAELAVFFHRGNIDRPYYLGANWGQTRADGNETPAETQLTPPDNSAISTPTFLIELNETEGSRACRVVNRRNGDFIEFDAERNTVSLKASTALLIKADGMVNIEAVVVQINGRSVLNSAEPI